MTTQVYAKKAQEGNGQILFEKIPFQTPADSQKSNIAFASKWDNFPDTLTIKTEDIKGERLHLLMAGTTNPMQSQMDNGKVVVIFENGTKQEFPLNNPNNWCLLSKITFMMEKLSNIQKKTVRPRLLLKTGEFAKEGIKYSGIKGFSNRAIDGGAANVYAIKIR